MNRLQDRERNKKDNLVVIAIVLVLVNMDRSYNSSAGGFPGIVIGNGVSQCYRITEPENQRKTRTIVQNQYATM